MREESDAVICPGKMLLFIRCHTYCTSHLAHLKDGLNGMIPIRKRCYHEEQSLAGKNACWKLLLSSASDVVILARHVLSRPASKQGLSSRHPNATSWCSVPRESYFHTIGRLLSNHPSAAEPNTLRLGCQQALPLLVRHFDGEAHQSSPVTLIVHENSPKVCDGQLQAERHGGGGGSSRILG